MCSASYFSRFPARRMDGAGLLFDFEDEDWGVGPAPGFRRRRERVFRPRVNLEWPLPGSFR